MILSQHTLVLRCSLCVETNTNGLLHSAEWDLQSLHKCLPSAAHLLSAHPNHGPVTTVGEINSNKELGQKPAIEILVKGDDVGDPKLITQSHGLSKLALIVPHILQTNRLHMWNKQVLLILQHHKYT